MTLQLNSTLDARTLQEDDLIWQDSRVRVSEIRVSPTNSQEVLVVLDAETQPGVYAVSIADAAVRDTCGRPLAAWQQVVDLQPPQLAASSLADGDRIPPGLTHCVLRMDEPIRRLSVDWLILDGPQGTQSLRRELTLPRHEVDGSRIIPLGDLQPGHYTVTSGTVTATDELGNVAELPGWEFAFDVELGAPRFKIPYDLEGDGSVDQHDVALLQHVMRNPEIGGKFDLNQDGTVDLLDLKGLVAGGLQNLVWRRESGRCVRRRRPGAAGDA
jgi:hypothetical protein